jgi:hypothetical protein
MVDNNEMEKRKHNKHHMNYSHAFLPSLLLPLPFLQSHVMYIRKLD